MKLVDIMEARLLCEVLIIGHEISIMIDYGEEVEIMTMDGIIEIQGLIDSDHVQHDIMFLAKKNGMIY